MSLLYPPQQNLHEPLDPNLSCKAMKLRAVLFDKDGTIIDFHRTWDLAVGTALRQTAPNEAALLRAAAALDFELATNTILDGSPLLAESNAVIGALVESFVSVEEFFAKTLEVSRSTLAPAPGLPMAFEELRSRAIALGLVTNDYEAPARDQMAILGWTNHFDCVVGSDTGFGAKPDPTMVIGALDLLGVRPENAVLVGDTSHDLRAGRAAGVTTVIVGNGDPIPLELSEMADLSIGRLPELIQLLEDHYSI